MLKKLNKYPKLKDYSKSDSVGLFDYLKPELDSAFTHAAWVLDQAVKDKNPDPSTRIHLMLNEFKALGEPQLLRAYEVALFQNEISPHIQLIFK